MSFFSLYLSVSLQLISNRAGSEGIFCSVALTAKAGTVELSGMGLISASARYVAIKLKTTIEWLDKLQRVIK